VVPLLSGCSLNQALASAWLAWPYRLDTSKDTPLAHLEAEAHMAQWLLAVQTQRHGECVGGDLVVVDLAAMAGLHREGRTEDKRETVFSSEISTPGPRKHTFGSQDDLSAVGGRWPSEAPPGWLACSGATAFHRPGRGCTRPWCGPGGRCRRKRGVVWWRIALRSSPCSLREFWPLSAYHGAPLGRGPQ
jgi:hypothetical protein